MSEDLPGCVVVIGASGRLGSAVCEALVRARVRVVAVDIDVSSLKKLSEEAPEYCVLVGADATELSSMQTALDVAEERFGSVRGAVHAAYPRTSDWGAKFEDVTEQSLKENLFGQLGGTILFSREVTSRMRETGGGSLVLVSSIQGVRAPRFDHYEGLSMSSPAEYTAIKAGVIAFTGWLAKYLAGTQVRVNCVSPGGIDADQTEVFKERYRADCLTKGLLNPEDVVGAIRFLLSEDSRFISGQNIVVDDGWSL